MIVAEDYSSNVLYRLVREFAVKTPAWAEAVRYPTKPDERHDLTLVSQRVYGTRDHFLVVQAAAGLDGPELELTERVLVMPTADQLRRMKLQAGFNANEA